MGILMSSENRFNTDKKIVEFARELGITTNTLVLILRELEIEVTGPTTFLNWKIQELVRSYLTYKK